MIQKTMIVSLMLSSSLAQALVCDRVFSDQPANGVRRETMSFGFEVEYVPQSNPKVLEDYRLPHLTDQAWKALTGEQKTALYQQHLTKRVRLTVDNLLNRDGLVRVEGAPDWLPESLEIEPHGTMEVRGLVFKTSREMKDYSNRLAERYGDGFYQSHVVTDKSTSLRFASFAVFDFEFYQAKNLSFSFEKFANETLTNSVKTLPNASFAHYALGPLSEATRTHIFHAENNANLGLKVGKGGSQRLTFGSSPRDDVYPDTKVGLELRNHNRQRVELQEATEDWAVVWEKDLSPRFDAFYKAPQISGEILKAFDFSRTGLSREEWGQVFQRLGKRLAQNSTFKWSTGGAPFEQRFLYSLRPWSAHPIMDYIRQPEARQGMKALIERAQQDFVISLADATRDFNDVDWLLVKARVGTAGFIYKTQVHRLFEEYKKQVITNDRRDTEVDLSATAAEILTTLPKRLQVEQSIAWDGLMRTGPLAGTSLSPYKKPGVWDGRFIRNILTAQGLSSLEGIPAVSKAYLVQDTPQGEKDWHVSLRLDLRSPVRLVNDKGEEMMTQSLILNVNNHRSIIDRGAAKNGSQTKIYRILERSAFMHKIGQEKHQLREFELKLDAEEMRRLMPTFLSQGERENNRGALNFSCNNCSTSTFDILTLALNESRLKWLAEHMRGGVFVRSGAHLPMVLKTMGLIQDGGGQP
ncbi:MAG: hypothetical protein KF802_04905 [Bdellovibrionaceae bacterium]|nr:hypothetical protein [Pseudobdellovibrionaceae bacterium]